MCMNTSILRVTGISIQYVCILKYRLTVAAVTSFVTTVPSGLTVAVVLAPSSTHGGGLVVQLLLAVRIGAAQHELDPPGRPSQPPPPLKKVTKNLVS